MSRRFNSYNQNHENYYNNNHMQNNNNHGDNYYDDNEETYEHNHMQNMQNNHGDNYYDDREYDHNHRQNNHDDNYYDYSEEKYEQDKIYSGLKGAIIELRRRLAMMDKGNVGKSSVDDACKDLTAWGSGTKLFGKNLIEGLGTLSEKDKRFVCRACGEYYSNHPKTYGNLKCDLYK